ncbi:MAG: bifunctional YncE family protein/alkaline phosphatase family protein [Isosphaeraceae bacterium]|nr:bifunctional YncE family protein/alkaline phosphatase family protein [Isosphaeraceae bacterium]
MNRRRISLVVATGCLLILAGSSMLMRARLGKQPDGSFFVSTGQRIEPGAISFPGRPIDLALHPTEGVAAVLSKTGVFLVDSEKVVPDSNVSLGGSPAYRGIAWAPDGSRLYAGTEKGHLQVFRYSGGKLAPEAKITIQPADAKGNPVPGGFVITKDGRTLFVVSANRGTVAEIDLAKNAFVREIRVQNIPFEVRLSEDESTLIVSNWGGRPPKPGEPTNLSDKVEVPVTSVNSVATGSVSLVDRKSGEAKHVPVAIHPTAIAVKGGRAFVANAMSDSISEIDIARAEVVRTIPVTWNDLQILGAMPNALAIAGDTLYVADGGDNAIAEVDIPSGKVRGFRPVGYFPTAVALTPDSRKAFVLNTKGNGSVRRTSIGQAGNAHDFQGTVTILDLAKPLADETAKVVANNRWSTKPVKPNLKVYNGAIEHVIYIIKENRTYDEIFGDMPEGNGDPKLCSLGEKVMPNHRAIARQFTLFDNGYVSGTNSADGHQWSTQGLANEYLEHFYVGYSRTYPCEGEDPMALSTAGCIWDAALAKKKSIRIYGEFCDEEKAAFEPKPKDWFEVWEDRKNKTNKFKFKAVTTVRSIMPYIHPEVHYWPLLQSDQYRADKFIEEYEKFSKEDKVPNLMVMSLPCDHAEGLDPKYPTPRAMMADNDLALGRVVEAVSKSPQWKSTCIFVIEDDAQAGPDHVDGHRTAFMAISPYTKRKYVDSSMYTTVSMLRSMGLMLGLDPMNRFDALAEPLVDCFTDTPDLTPYKAVPNNVPLDERNPSGKAMTEQDRYWLAKTMELDWSHLDTADQYWLNRINWYSIFKGTRPYPDRPGDAPGQFDADDDDDE